MTDPEQATTQQHHAEHDAEAPPGPEGGESGTAPAPGATWVADHEPPASEAERQAMETVRSVSRLEESN